ncbi:MAG: OmpA family protein [Steroidobacteraceae bacterium]
MIDATFLEERVPMNPPDRTMLNGCLALALAGALAACASAPQRNARLDQARTAVASLQQDPDAGSAASQPLEDAQRDLNQANTAFEHHKSAEDVSYLAYLALREAQIGKEQTDAYRAQAQIAKAAAERNRILLEARTREAQHAQSAAESAHAAAESQAREASAARAQAQSAQQQLQKEQQDLASLKARQTQRGVELTLASNVLFNTNQSDLKPGATLQLSRLADFMRANPRTRIIVEGYTDSRGSAAYNEKVSEERAQAVASVLEAQGIAQDRVQTVGRGKNFPVASNATSAGRQQNRRVDIILSNMSGRFAEGATQGPALR